MTALRAAYAPVLVNNPNTAQPEGPLPHPKAATLELRQVSKTYPGADRPAIADLSFEVPAGEICVLVGPSGSGKTTAMRLINRMIDLSGGDILLDGRSILQQRPAELRRHIGYAIQQIGLFPHLTVAENIATVPRLLGWDKARIRARVDELITLIGLDPRLMRRRYPSQLSGGQAQRVGVARALAADPPLLLMDEPFGAIDPINRGKLQSEFLRLQHELRKTVVFVTHDIDEAIKIGDRIAVLKEGGVLAQYAPPSELLMRPADDFVAGFVGADAALKRLALGRVGEVRLRPAPEIRDGEPPANARERARAAGLPYPLVVDDAGRPTGWLRDGGEQVPVFHVAPDEVLRDALDGLLRSDVQYAAVLNGDGRARGVLSVGAIHDFLASEERR
jgi:osmoprotectant transport system ATP-binding protein